MAIAIIIVLLVIGSLVFHFVSPWWFTPLASNWQAIDSTMNLTLWVVGIVFVVVNLFLAYVIYRFRYQKNRRAAYEPENSKLETSLTVITTIGVAGMLVPGLFVWGQFVTVPEESDLIEVVGQQWHWSFRLPGKDGVLGRTAIETLNEQNPFGLDINDKHSADDILIQSNVLHIPVNKAVKVLLRSKDVLHNFAVPQFRVKMDLVPGIVSYLWFSPTKVGRYEILCEELCGIAHYTMRGYVVVDSEDDYQHWLAKQTTFKQSMEVASTDIHKGKQMFAVCSACHGVNGEGNTALNAPKLAGLSTWYLERQLLYYKNNIRGLDKSDVYGQQMLAVGAGLQDPKAISNVVAYIQTLPDTPLNSAVITDVQSSIIAGKKLFKSCSFCHGDNAQGNYAMNAPKLVGQHDWYLKRQLQAFKTGTRGSHPSDLYGDQMILMSKTLHSEQAVNDVVSYINSLQKSE